ncbi:hypothetical protein EfmAA96_34390 (plasmid) [Enterococcus faecium]|nr:hypothetical protein EfmAA96_34390 [Enterococcus faecium]
MNFVEPYMKNSFLIQNSKYSKMKDSSKIAYMLFKNEFRRALHEYTSRPNGQIKLLPRQSKNHFKRVRNI